MFTQQEYWDAMPEWMRKGYVKELVVFKVVQSAMAANLPPSELVSKCGEFLLRALQDTRQRMLDQAMMNSAPVVIKG